MPRPPRTSPRKAPQQNRSQTTVQVILDATARVLVSTGYDRASTNRIAVAAGVSVGSVYQYFPSKEALVAALIERHVEEMTSVNQGMLVELADAPIEEAVRVMSRAIFRSHRIDPALHRVLVEQVPRVGRLGRLTEMEGETRRVLRMVLEARRSELRVVDLDAAVFLIATIVSASVHRAIIEVPSPAGVDALVTELCDLLIRYLKA
jgi:AcrR family transcriptional regulator